VLTTLFLTMQESRAEVNGPRDSLGAQTIWTRFARPPRGQSHLHRSRWSADGMAYMLTTKDVDR